MFLPAHLSMPVSSAISWVNLRFELYVVASVSGLGLLDCKFQNVPMYNVQPEKIGINSLDSKAITDNSFSSICEIWALHGIPQCRMGIKKKDRTSSKTAKAFMTWWSDLKSSKPFCTCHCFPIRLNSQQRLNSSIALSTFTSSERGTATDSTWNPTFWRDWKKRCSPQKSLGASGLAT